jgi:hypothetical protein
MFALSQISPAPGVHHGTVADNRLRSSSRKKWKMKRTILTVATLGVALITGCTKTPSPTLKGHALGETKEQFLASSTPEMRKHLTSCAAYIKEKGKPPYEYEARLKYDVDAIGGKYDISSAADTCSDNPHFLHFGFLSDATDSDRNGFIDYALFDEHGKLVKISVHFYDPEKIAKTLTDTYGQPKVIGNYAFFKTGKYGFMAEGVHLPNESYLEVWLIDADFLKQMEEGIAANVKKDASLN